MCEGLLRAGHAVRVFEKRNVHRGNVAAFVANMDWHEGDFANQNEIHEAVEGIDIVFHLIGTTLPQNSNENPAYDLSTNLISTVKLLDVCKASGVKKVIFFSSGGTVYGIPQLTPIPEDHPTNPISSYGIHKLAIEKYLMLYQHLYGLDYAILRIANPYGPRQNAGSGQGAVAAFLQKAVAGEPVEIWGDGSVVRDYLHVSDVVSACIAVMGEGVVKTIVNIGSGVGLSLIDLVRKIEEAMGQPLELAYKSGRRADVPANVLDISKALTLLGWTPRVSLDAGLRETLAFIRATAKTDNRTSR